MSDEFFRGKIVVLTGGAKGLGRALALKFASAGAVVIVTYKTSRHEAVALQKELSAFDQRSGVFKLDVRNEGQVAAVFKKIFAQHKKIDVLVNLVGNFIYEPIEETTFEKFKDVIETNLYSTFLMSKIALEKMKKQKSGQIINFGCAAADRMTIRELTTPYYIAKTGVLMLTKILANAYAPYGIKVNAVSPGILETSVAKHKVPTGRYAQFQDIWNAVKFLLAPESEYINGANIEVSGGWVPGVGN
ncbi:MAG: SDR family oxidoreductase [Candidatus Magasanikbacteria bacterium]|nr:SDR family oxidoreductase [Candidatus Magasanikbacteria bacterium]